MELDNLIMVDRKTARNAYLNGAVVTVLESGFNSDTANEIWQFGFSGKPIKTASKVRKFNRRIAEFAKYVGIPSFWIYEN